MKLIEAVKNEQAKRNLNDAQLSRLLKIDQSLWSRIKKGEYRPTRKFLIGVMNNLPELALEVIDYMRNEPDKKAGEK
jgi:transcriptional regulator with XRE-family HTH domain